MYDQYTYCDTHCEIVMKYLIWNSYASFNALICAKYKKNLIPSLKGDVDISIDENMNISIDTKWTQTCPYCYHMYEESQYCEGQLNNIYF